MRILLQAVLTRLIRVGSFTIRYPDGRSETFGPGSGPSAAMVLRDWDTGRRLLTNPALEFGQAYVDRRLEPVGCELSDLLDLFFTNLQAGGTHPALGIRRALSSAHGALFGANPLARARRNVAHHYDLNGRLYSLFLDRDRQYSCAYFECGDETLEEAQTAKKRHIAAKLLFDRPDLRVLDIGCGWGGMALTLAQDYGALVTGITLSVEQQQAAQERIAAAGLTQRVRILLRDYRTLEGQFDRIVSVGMFEHVGIAHYGDFFATVRRLLTQDGIALIHAIGRADGPGVTNPWIARNIFPGGYAPALSEVFRAVEKSGLIATDCEILRLHYAETLRHWRRRFAANRDTIASLYDERFCRMFDLYLTGAEMTFRRLGHMVWQLQLTPRLDTLPLTRDYLLTQDHIPVRPARTPPAPPTLRRDARA